MVGFSLVKKVILSLRVSSFTFIWTEINIKCYPCQMLFFYLKALYFIISKYLHFLFNQWFDWFAACKDRKLNKIAFEQNLSISWKSRKTKKWNSPFWREFFSVIETSLSISTFPSISIRLVAVALHLFGLVWLRLTLLWGRAWHIGTGNSSFIYKCHIQKNCKLYINPHQVDSLLD